MQLSINQRYFPVVKDKKEQFIELYEPVHTNFCRYCRAISGNTRDAEDLVQDSILGSQVKIVLSETTFPEGHNNYNLDLSGINPGIYLISIQSDKGIKTQRLIISQ